MSGETNLQKLIKEMQPILNDGEYVFSTVKNLDGFQREDTIGEFKETEGITIIIKKQKADELGLKYDYVACWITLKVHSSLEAVGLTAVFSKALADHQISCNVIAGYYHDHIFVNKTDAHKAIEVLNKLTENF